jgi:uncharacterized membrane protein required for colicin V production
MSLDKLPVNVFDLVLLIVIISGIVRGRKHGMSEELFDLFKWITVVVAGALIYEPVGNQLAKAAHITLLSAYLLTYVVCAVLVILIFAVVKRSLGGKLVGSDVFGRTEYYLGMGSGLVRFLCILLAGLALLNARFYPRAEVVAMEKFQNDVYGTNYFPTWHTAQEIVFEKSISGPVIKQYFGFFLIKPTLPEDTTFHQKEADFADK